MLPKILRDMQLRKCCVIIGPPKSGTTSTLLAIRAKYQQKAPLTIWWDINLTQLPRDDTEKLFSVLALQATTFFPNQAELWRNVRGRDDFYQTLMKSLE